MKRSAAFVPRHLLVGWPPGNPAARRRYVTAAIFIDARGDEKAGIARSLQVFWAPAALERHGSPTVLSVLLELEEMGVLSSVEQHDDGFRIRLADREAAA